MTVKIIDKYDIHKTYWVNNWIWKERNRKLKVHNLYAEDLYNGKINIVYVEGYNDGEVKVRVIEKEVTEI